MRVFLTLLAGFLVLGCGDDGASGDAGPERDAHRDAPADDGPVHDGAMGDAGRTDAGDPPIATDCTMVTCYHVRADAPAGGDGASWSSALTQVPDEPERGAVYLVADGSYASLTLDAPESGEEWISISKAIEADHGTDDGWDPAYGDGQAEFPDVTMVSDRWVVDGRTRDETNWARLDAYGFRITGGVTAHTINFGRGSNDVVFRYVDVGGPAGDTFDPGLPDSGFYFGGFDDVLARWTISRSHVHNVYIAFQIAGASDVVIERSWLGPNWSKETIRGQIHASRIVIRHNVMKDGCQGTPGDPTAGGCTAQIAMWGSDNPGDYDGSEIYGNVIWTTRDTTHSDACIFVGGDGGISAAGVSANDVLVYNNTLVGVQNGRCGIRMPGIHTGTVVANNVWHGLASGVTAGCDADTCENNEDLSGTSPFVNAASGDFRLAGPTAPGTVLPAPYDVDLTGAMRGADGVWDLGAYEHATTP